VSDTANTLLFVVWCGAMFVLFALGVRLPIQPRPRGAWRLLIGIGSVVVALGLAFAANVALHRHDVHYDLTRERVATPSAAAREVVERLDRDVQLTYFYQAQDPSGRRAKELLEILGRRSPHLHVTTVDPDRQPRAADASGVRIYNAAILEAEGRRLQVQSTDESEIALGILRVLRRLRTVLCFMEGHGEYSVDNFEYHTHFDTPQAHSHGGESSGVVLTERHGAGRWRRALESLGFEVRRIIPAMPSGIPDDCAAVVDVNPRTTYLRVESDLLERHLARGGGAVLLYDLGFVLEPGLEALLARLGVAVADEAIVDPTDHYSTDAEILAVPVYEPHPITDRLALTFYPGARPLELRPPAAGLIVRPLFTSSRDSYTRPVVRVPQHDPLPRPASSSSTSPSTRQTDRRVVGAAIEGRWPNARAEAKPFRVVVVGDADFASNSFFPYMANSDLALALVRWVVGEERRPSLTPRVPALPTVTLTRRQMQQIFLSVGVVLPLAVMVAGGVVWWRRR
jgi:gliding motility-associatede transport system auxiliary component